MEAEEGGRAITSDLETRVGVVAEDTEREFVLAVGEAVAEMAKMRGGAPGVPERGEARRRGNDNDEPTGRLGGQSGRIRIRDWEATMPVRR